MKSLGGIAMSDFSHREIITRVLDSLFHVIGQNTTPSFAWLTLRIALQKTCYHHQFVHLIDIGDIDSIKNLKCQDTGFCQTSITSVDEEIEHIPVQQVGRCLLDLINELRRNMEPQAGYILLHQFRNDLGEEWYHHMETIGVDLQLSEVQRELYGWNKEPLENSTIPEPA
jgi:hypothetical protein